MSDGLSTFETFTHMLDRYQDGVELEPDALLAHAKELEIYPGPGMPVQVVLETLEEHTTKELAPAILRAFVETGVTLGLWVQLNAEELMPNEEIRTLIMEQMPNDYIFPMLVAVEWEEKLKVQIQLVNEQMENLLSKIGDLSALKQALGAMRS